MRSVIYTRASLDRTGEGKSNSRQREECQRLIDYKRWETVAVEEDVSISAYGNKERPAWIAVLGMIERGEVDAVVAFHLDRLTRNMADLEKLILLCEANNVLVATVTGDMDLTNDTGRMVARILAAVARQEVERKAARQKLAHVQRRQEGRPWAGVKMLGYTRQGAIIKKEADAIRKAVEQVIENSVSLAQIARDWREAGLTSPYHREGVEPWSPRGVRSVLTNPRLAGLMVADGVVIGSGNWEPIIEESTLTLAISRLSDPSRTSGSTRGGKGRLPSNLLTGIMVCARCDQTVRAGSKRGTFSYMCPNWHTAVPREDADNLVIASFAATVALTRTGSVIEGLEADDPDTLSSETRALRERQDMLASSFARGVISGEAFESATVAISEQVDALGGRMIEANSEADLREVRAGAVRDFEAQGWAEQRRTLSRLAVIRMHPAKGHRSSARTQIEVQVRQKRGEGSVLVPAHLP